MLDGEINAVIIMISMGVVAPSKVAVLEISNCSVLFNSVSILITTEDVRNTHQSMNG